MSEEAQSGGKRREETTGTTYEEAAAELLKRYRRFRYLVFALGACCIIVMIAAMGLYKAQIVDADGQNMMIMVVFILVAIMLVLAFTRVQPLKKDMRDLQSGKKPAQSKVASVKDSSVPFFGGNGKTPNTPEYRRYHAIWRACIVVAVIIMMAAMALIRMYPDQSTIAIVVLFSSYIFLGISVYLDLKKLKPMRQNWQRQLAKAEKKARKSKK